MTDSRLLVAIEVLDFLRTLRRQDQERLLKRFREIAAQFPIGNPGFSLPVPQQFKG
jgi:hypothetical protein